MANTSVDNRIDSVAKDIQTLVSELGQDEAARKKLLGVVMGAVSQVETPVETIWRLIMSTHAPAALNTLIKIGVVTELAKAESSLSANDLATSCGADSELIVRLMRPLLALGIFKETGVQEYKSTAISKTLTAPPLMGGYQFMFECATRSLAMMPTYLEKNSWKNVTASPGPFEFSHNTDDGMFAYLNKDPAMMSNFNAFMAGSLEARKSWYETFPVDEILLNGASSNHDDVLLIDVGGGEGHDVEAFHRSFPNAIGKLVLQDLPPTIDNIKHLDDVIIRQKHDFFTEQPIKSARAYYFRNIFHDWPDSHVIEIMKNTAAAMKPGYSKMLIFEWILPAKGVPLYPALLDVNMMAVLNGQERTKEQWDKLLDAAGLKATKVWKGAEDAEGLIEAELK